VLNYDLPIEKVVARLAGRRTCPKCKAGLPCDHAPAARRGRLQPCGTKLEQREDDRPEAVRVRMEVYEKSTKPLTDFYRQRGLLLTIEPRARRRKLPAHPHGAGSAGRRAAPPSADQHGFDAEFRMNAGKFFTRPTPAAANGQGMWAFLPRVV